MALGPSRAAAVTELPASTGATTDGQVRAIEHDALGGDTYIAGAFTEVCDHQGANCVARENIARLNADGSLDPAWEANATGYGTVNALALSDGGGVLYVGTAADAVAFEAATGDQTAWDPNPNGAVLALDALNAGLSTVVYAGGAFTQIGGESRSNLAELDVAGEADAAFPETDGFVNSVAATGTQLLAGGSFDQIGPDIGTDDDDIAHLAAVDRGSGQVDTGFAPSADDDVFTIETSTEILTGGDFAQVDGQARARIAAVNTLGEPLQWAPNANSTVRAIAITPGAVFAGGGFTSIGGQPRSRVAELGTPLTAGAATSWDPATNADVRALAATANGDTVFVGGEFTEAGGEASAFLAVFGTPELSAPSQTDLGEAAVGSVGSPEAIAVSNPGSGDLVVSGAELLGAGAAEFELGTDTCTGERVAPGSQCEIEVRLAPSSTGAKQAELRLTSNAATSPDEVELTGSAVEAPPPVLEPEIARRAKGKLDRKQRVTIADVSCRTGPCSVRATQPKVRIAGKAYRVKTLFPARLEANESAEVELKVAKRRTLKALRKAGKGRALVEISVSGPSGETVSVRPRTKIRT